MKIHTRYGTIGKDDCDGDCVPKDDLRKLVEKWRRVRGKVYQEEDGTFSRIPLSGINYADDLEKLLKRGE